MIRRLISLVWLSGALLWGQRAGELGEISGTVLREDGQPAAGATLYATRPWTAPNTGPPVSVATKTGRNGGFVLASLPPGAWRLCPQMPRTEWLDPCRWSARRETVKVDAGQVVTRATVTMRRGYLLPIRVVDTGAWLSRFEGKAQGASLSVGIAGGPSQYTPVGVTTTEAGARVHRVAIPFDAPLKVQVSSSYFDIEDEAGVKAGARGKVIAVQVKRSEASREVVVRVTGVKGR